MSVTRTGQAGADDVGGVDVGRPPAPARGAQGAEHGPVTSSAQKGATAQARHGRREHGGRGKAGRTAKQEAVIKMEGVKDQHAGLEPELDESWEERVAKFDKLEDAKLDAMLDAREEAWIEWYKKVGIHKEFARGYARHAACMSC